MRIPQTPPPFDHRRLLGAPNFQAINKCVKSAFQQPRYFHWDDLRYRSPPDGLTREEWWDALKFMRTTQMQAVPLLDKNGNPFSFNIPDIVAELLHQIDRNGGTLIQLPEPVTNPDERIATLSARSWRRRSLRANSREQLRLGK
jgi:hypothetical protein